MDLETVIQSGVSQNEKNKCINAYVWNLEKWYKERKCRSFSHVQLFVTPWTGHGILQAGILEWVAFLFSRGIFPTQESNWGLLHCRQKNGIDDLICKTEIKTQRKRTMDSKEERTGWGVLRVGIDLYTLLTLVVA